MADGLPRREFLKRSAWVAAVTPLSLTRCTPDRRPRTPVFEISLAQWSLHRMLFASELPSLEFPAFARTTFDIDAVEYVNVFFNGERTYVDELIRRTSDIGVRSLLIMVDREGDLGDPSEAARRRSVQRHHRWVEIATRLDCHSIRVNARSGGTPQQQHEYAVDGLRQLTEFAAPHGINVLVENHGGLSSNGRWLADVIRAVDHPRCGTLPDFGNFLIEGDQWYDRYRGVKELMPFARAVSAKSHDFDDEGNEIHTDYRRMMRIVLEAGYRGHVGIEYEGETLSEIEGVKATKVLLERVGEELAMSHAP